MNDEDIKSTLGLNKANNKVFMSVNSKNIQHHLDTESCTVTVSIYEDAKAGRKIIDTLRVRMEPEFLSVTLGVTMDELQHATQESTTKIIDATIRIVKFAFKRTRGKFSDKEIVQGRNHDLDQQK